MTTVVFDIESYPNFFLVALKNIEAQEVLTVECTDDNPLSADDADLLRTVITEDLCIGFNSINYDMPMVWAALAGRTASELYQITQSIIVENLRSWEVERAWKFRVRPTNHIDLIEVAPLKDDDDGASDEGFPTGLKVYNGRLHGKRMQDLPFEVGTRLTPDQMTIVRDYCVNDLAATELLLKVLEEPLALRDDMSIQYKQDLRSKSDAQIAEAVIQKEVERITGRAVRKPDNEPPGQFFYVPPAFIQYKTPYMQDVLRQVCTTPIIVNEFGRVKAPGFKSFVINLGKSTYKIGIGGIHSQEKSRSLYSTDTHLLIDRDVASYYPALIINNNLSPAALGEHFAPLYRGMRDRRIEAKRAKQKVIAESLKITLNGAFGKLGQPGSILYAPRQMINTTLTGQLALLMAIEEVELAGIDVVSANTDGFTSMVPVSKRDQFNAIMSAWEKVTNFETEEVVYRSMHNSSVNAYIAIKEDGSVKGKNAFFDPWSASPPDYRGQLSKNPQTTVCVSAVVAWLTNGTPLADTIRACQDIRQFVTVRKVNGGAVWQGQYLGKAVRWYYAKGQFEPIRYASNGNRVSKSDGAMPCMELPDALPADIDYDWYEREVASMLVDIGAVQGPRRRGEPDERQVDLFAEAA